jgi:hypothetical protein
MEFDFDDDPGAGDGVPFALYLREWIVDGCRWFHPDKRPSGWSLQDQLRAAGILESGNQTEVK